jgi:nitrite transporter
VNINETCSYFADVARNKGRIAAGAPGAFFVASMLAGAYVGIALILAWTTSFGLPAGVRPLVQGSVFGVGLILVVLAGAEMFTGHVMYETFGVSRGTIGWLDLVRMWVLVWLGNLVGSALLAFIFAQTNGLIFTAGDKAPGDILAGVITKKETSPFLLLFCKAILCNWLVCLAIWLAARLKSETAKMIGIAWCLLAFVACGFEHSVANMTAVCLGLFAPHPTGAIGPALYNLGTVSLGNLVGGALFVTGAYLWSARGESVTLTPAAPTSSTAAGLNRPGSTPAVERA